MRRWKTHDLVDLFRSIRNGSIPLSTKQFTNGALNDDPQIRIKKLDVDWPQHMEVEMEPTDSSPEYKIETGIPLPRKHTAGFTFRWLEVLKQLEPGQSFLIPLGENDKRGGVATRIQVYAKKYCPGKLFATRTIKTDTSIGLRVWRLE